MNTRITRHTSNEGREVEVVHTFPLSREQPELFGIPKEFWERFEFQAVLLDCGHFVLQDNDPEGGIEKCQRGDKVKCRPCLIEQQRLETLGDLKERMGL